MLFLVEIKVKEKNVFQSCRVKKKQENQKIDNHSAEQEKNVEKKEERKNQVRTDQTGLENSTVMLTERKQQVPLKPTSLKIEI